MANDANAITDEDFDALSQAGFSPNEIKELLGVIDLAMMFNCYTSALRLPIDPQYKAIEH
jgi:alkylhydroperoxidase family enzyme